MFRLGTPVHFWPRWQRPWRTICELTSAMCWPSWRTCGWRSGRTRRPRPPPALATPTTTSRRHPDTPTASRRRPDTPIASFRRRPATPLCARAVRIRPAYTTMPTILPRCEPLTVFKSTVTYFSSMADKMPTKYKYFSKFFA
jgi:hypothetical protein